MQGPPKMAIFGGGPPKNPKKPPKKPHFPMFKKNHGKYPKNTRKISEKSAKNQRKISEKSGLLTLKRKLFAENFQEIIALFWGFFGVPGTPPDPPSGGGSIFCKK